MSDTNLRDQDFLYNDERSTLEIPTTITPHTPKIATIESSRQPTTIRKTRELTQARLLKQALKVGALASVLGVAGVVSAQQLNLVSASVTVNTSLPDAPQPVGDGEESVSAGEYRDSMIRVTPQPQLKLSKRERFWTPLMVGLFAGDAVVRGLDAISTNRNLSNPCRCFQEDVIPFATGTPAGTWAFSEGVVVANIVASYTLHRLHHDRLAKLVPVVDMAYDSPAVVKNFRIAGVRP